MTGLAAARGMDRGGRWRPPRFARPGVVLACGLALLAVLAALSFSLGAINLTPNQVWAGLTSDADVFERSVVWKIRYPRFLDGALVGASLALAGGLLQGVTRNPLADSTILGVTAAAGLASAVMLVVSPTAPHWGVALVCVGGGVGGALLLFVIAWRGSVSPVRLALSGVALSAFFGAVIVGLISTSRTFIQTSVGFLAGGLYGKEWEHLWVALPYIAPAAFAALLLAGRLNVLALGDDIAAGLGVLTDRTRLVILAVAGVLTGAAVSIAGLVSFVGLVCPHLARMTVGSDQRYVIPVAAVFGAILVTAADLFARLVISPAEIPFGIVTAGLGASFLLWLVRVRG